METICFPFNVLLRKYWGEVQSLTVFQRAKAPVMIIRECTWWICFWNHSSEGTSVRGIGWVRDKLGMVMRNSDFSFNFFHEIVAWIYFRIFCMSFLLPEELVSNSITMHATEHSGRNRYIGLKLTRFELMANYKYLIWNILVTLVGKDY